jgi:hypothetical protein
MTQKSLFQKATPVARRLKILLYGGSGSGKTLAALSFPRPVVIDAESGTDLYRGRPGIPEFYVMATKSVNDLESAIAEIAQDNGRSFDTLVIDPITVFYDVLKEVVARGEKTGEMNPRAWNKVNGRMNGIYNRLTNLPVHVIVISRLAIEYEGEGLNLRKVGQKPDVDKKIAYAFDFVVRMNPDRTGLVEKSRGVMLPEGNVLKTVNYSTFVAAVEAFTTGTPVTVQSDEEAIERDAAAEQQQSQPPAQKPANGSQPKPPVWWNKVIDTAKLLPHFGGQPKHVINALNKMIGDGEIMESWNAGQVIEAVKAKYDTDEAPAAEYDENSIPF